MEKLNLKLERAQKGYTKEDLWSIQAWFIQIIPKMLKELKATRYGTTPSDTELDEIIQAFKEAWDVESDDINEDDTIVLKAIDLFRKHFMDLWD